MVIPRNWSRRAAATTAVALMAGAAVAAGGAAASSARSAAASKASAASSRPAGKITILVYGDSQNSVEKWAVAQYNKTAEGHQVKAVLNTIPGANYQTKLQTIMSTSSAPDVFFNWGGGSILQFQKAGLLMPLNSFFKANPKLKSSFLPAILNAAKIGGNYYGVPMRGTQPVVMFYNKSVLSSDGVAVPKTWSQLLSAVSKLKSKGVQVPIALGGGDQWPTLMWFEYMYDRVAGPGLITDALAGKPALWNSGGSKKALGAIKQLIDAGGFGPSKSWDSVKFTAGQTAQMMVNGIAAFELMGSWDYSTIQSQGSTATGTNPPNGPGAAFVKAGKLGWAAFPSVPGGKGNSGDLAGNTENYYSVLKSTRYPQAVADFLKILYTPNFVKNELAIGNLTTTTNTPKLISGADAPWLRWQYQLVHRAPAFQLSWDQAWPQTDSTTIHTAVANYFDNLDSAQFIKAMEGLKSAG
jgi:xylobiose transport system substrate-binding protein